MSGSQDFVARYILTGSVNLLFVYPSDKMAGMFDPNYGTVYYRTNDPIKNLKIR